uniref:Uncharacterized protein n=1 Tax=Romanomermis culicivorax TaxID=13658 RepID=A0A915JRI8_ROMCU
MVTVGKRFSLLLLLYTKEPLLQRWAGEQFFPSENLDDNRYPEVVGETGFFGSINKDSISIKHIMGPFINPSQTI